MGESRSYSGEGFLIFASGHSVPVLVALHDGQGAVFLSSEDPGFTAELTPGPVTLEYGSGVFAATVGTVGFGDLGCIALITV